MKIILIGNNSEELWFDRGTCISSFISDLLILRSKKSFTFIKYYSICYLLQVCNMLTAPEQWVGVKLQYIEQSVQVVVLVTCTCPKWSNNVSRYYCQWGNIIWSEMPQCYINHVTLSTLPVSDDRTTWTLVISSVVVKNFLLLLNIYWYLFRPVGPVENHNSLP